MSSKEKNMEKFRDQEQEPDSKFRLTVEVPCFALYLCTAITGTAMANALISRTCIHVLGHSEEMCQLLNEPGEKPPEVQEIETEVQRYTTTIFTVKSVADGLIPAILALFLGPWSNKFGRKPLIIWTIFAYALSIILMILYSYFGSLGPWWFIGTSLPFSFAGGTSAFSTGAFCLLNDITNNNNKTLRLSIMTASIFSGLIVGLLGSSFLYGIIGTIYLLFIGLCVSLCGFGYAFLLIKESVPKTSNRAIGTVFDLSLVSDMFRTCFKRRPSYGRLVIALLIIPNTIDLFVNQGNTQMEYLYARQKLNWTLSDQNLFHAVNTFIMTFGLFFGVVLLQRLFKLTDAVTTMISYISCILEAIIKAFVTATWMMYFASGISVFRGLSFPVLRAMMSKRLERNDTAKVFALMSAIDTSLPLVAPLTYNSLYRATLDSFPGAMYFLSAGLYLICFVLIWAARCVMTRHPLQKKSVSESPATTNL